MVFVMPRRRSAALPRIRLTRHSPQILTFGNKSKIKSKNPCFAFEFFVPLHRQMRKVEKPAIKDKNCEY